MELPYVTSTQPLSEVQEARFLQQSMHLLTLFLGKFFPLSSLNTHSLTHILHNDLCKNKKTSLKKTTMNRCQNHGRGASVRGPAKDTMRCSGSVDTWEDYRRQMTREKICRIESTLKKNQIMPHLKSVLLKVSLLSFSRCFLISLIDEDC